MEQLSFDYHALRARKARFGKRLNVWWRAVLAAVAGILVFVGGILLTSNDSSGWFVASLAGIPVFIFALAP